MARTAWIAALFAGGVLILLLLAAALVVAAGPGEESIETSGVVTLDPSARSLEIPLATTGNALTIARRNGRVLVGLAVDPERIQAAVVRGERAVRVSDLTFTVDGRVVTPSACGHACWEFDVRRPRELVVKAPETVRFELPAVLPSSGARTFAAVTRTMEGLRTYRFDETLTSGVGSPTRSTWEVQAPDRMRFRTTDGFRAVVVGRSRWDSRGGRWQRSAYSRLDLPSYMWDGATGARVLPGPGGSSTTLAVFDPEPVPAWFKLTIDDQAHVVDAEMLAPSHFMRQRFYDFNVPLTIEPPAS